MIEVTPRDPHVVQANWRTADVVALSERIFAVHDWLEHTDDLLAMFSDQTEIATELRSIAARMRTARDDFTHRADELKAQLVDQNGGES